MKWEKQSSRTYTHLLFIHFWEYISQRNIPILPLDYVFLLVLTEICCSSYVFKNCKCVLLDILLSQCYPLRLYSVTIIYVNATQYMVALEVTNHGIGTDVFTSFWLVNLFTSLTKIRYGSNCLLTVTPMKVCLVSFSSFPCLTFPISWFPTRRIICMSVTWMFVILYIFFDFINATYFIRQNEWILFLSTLIIATWGQSFW